ncbi:MAG: NUDIX domain-containing protein [Gammaproteobacteria bacterium]|nr:NUDIX domain-containing protein [Gammaproteobacteria bacterium]
MWEFPAVEVEDGTDTGARPMRVAEPAVGGGEGGGRAPAARSMQVAEPVVGTVVELPPVTHRFSHFTAVYRPQRVEVAAEWGEAAGRWVTSSELADLPLPVAQQRIARAAGF